jgi:hypothetical protein
MRRVSLLYRRAQPILKVKMYHILLSLILAFSVTIRAQLVAVAEETCPANATVYIYPIFLSTVVEEPATLVYFDQLTVEVTNAPSLVIIETFIRTTVTVTAPV